MDQEKTGEVLESTPVARNRTSEKLYLEVLFGPQKGHRCVLGDQETVIGRGPDSQMVLLDATVSLRHAAIHRGADGINFVDLGSTNGIRFFGKKVTEGRLEEGNTIELGTTVIALRAGTGVSSTPPPSVPNLNRTQQMPAARPRAVAPQAPGPVAPMADVGMADEVLPIRERTRRTPLLVKAISWLVVLSLVLGGLLVVTRLLDEVSSHSWGKASPAQKKEKVAKARQRVSLQEPEAANVLLEDSPVDAAPDVALEEFTKAMALEAKGDYDKAIEALNDVARKYPEFNPPTGRQVQEHVDTIARFRTYRDALGKARKALEEPTAGVEELKGALQDLAQIPTEEVEFYNEAAVLNGSIRRKMQLIEEGLVPTPEAPQEMQDTEEPAASTGGDSAAAPATLDEVNSLYDEGKFADALTALDRVIAAESDEAARKKLDSMRVSLNQFQRAYREGRAAENGEGPQVEIAISRFETALKMDGALTGKYSSNLKQRLAGLHAGLARRYLDEGAFGPGALNLTKARGYQPGNEEVKRLSTAYEHRAREMLREAQSDLDKGDPSAAQAKLDQVMALASDMEGVRKDAEELGREVRAQP